MYSPGAQLELAINLLVEGVLKANQSNYYWSLGFLRRFIDVGMEIEDAQEIWSRVAGSSAGAQADFDNLVSQANRSTTVERE